MRIGLLSDTHGWIHPSIYEHFAACDEIWHAGDIGNMETADALAAFRPLRAVYGNIDNHIVRSAWPLHQRFTVEGVRVWITHAGGYPGNYDRTVRSELKSNPPDLFICGHSHITRIMYDDSLGMLVLNPGASGYSGFHKIMTILRFSIDNSKIHNMELIELGERGRAIIE